MIRLAKLGAAPLLLRVDGSTYAVASEYDADFALVHIRTADDASRSTGLKMMRVKGETAFCVQLAYKQYELIYAQLNMLTNATPKLTQVAGATLLATRPLVTYGDHAPQLDLEAALGERSVRPDPEVLRTVLDYCGTGNVPERGTFGDWRDAKVTGEHHTLLSPEEVVAASPPQRAYVLAAALTEMRSMTDTRAAVSGILAYVAAADERCVEKFVRSSILEGCGGAEEFARRAKNSTADLKAHQHYTDFPLEQMFELQVLANRGVGGVDWGVERLNRVSPKLVNITPGVVRDVALRIFRSAEAEGYRYPTESWDEYWKRRWSFVPNGSVHSQYAEDQAYIDKDRKRRTKNFTLLKVADGSINRWTKRQPSIVGWASVKYEWAKERAIYGTDLTSYLLTDFAMPLAEEALSHRFPVGRRADEDYVARRLALAGDTGVAFCFDYEDFNSQHSLESMEAVVSAYVEAFESSMSAEQKQAADWVVSSVRQQYVHAPNADYQTRGTLLSGWRLTTFVNTVLNYAYLEACGALSHTYDSVHNGDDVLCYAVSVGDAVSMLNKTKGLSIRAQASKCAIGGLEEFLRVDRKAERPTGRQYLARALATLVHARAESAEPQDMRAAVKANTTRLDEAAGRGADATFIENATRIVSARTEDVFKAPRGMVADMKNTHIVHGGLNDDPDVEPRLVFSSPFTNTGGDLREFEALPGVKSFSQYLIDFFKLERHNANKVTKSIAAVTRSYVAPSRVAMEVSPVGNTDVARVEQYLHRVCQHDYQVAAFTGKARLTGLPIGKMPLTAVTGMARERIAASSNPIRTMAIIF